MAKLFKLALESSDLEGAVAPESTQPALDEAELEQNVEETTQEQAEIEQGGEEIDQALEEAEGLAEQIEANDEKLENPDAVVTAADVEVSEEALKRACYSLGIPFQAKLSFASESVANDIRANARKYLATSNEELKDKLKAIVEAVKKMIAAVAEKVRTWIAKASLKLGNYKKVIENNEKVLKDIKTPLTRNLRIDLFNELAGKNDAYINYVLNKNEVDTSSFKELQKLTNRTNITDIANANYQPQDVTEFGFKKPEDDNLLVLGIIGSTGLALHALKGEYVRVSLEKLDDGVNETRFDDDKSLKSILGAIGDYKKAASNGKAFLDANSKVQKKCIEELDKLAKSNKDDKELNKALKAAKSTAIVACGMNAQIYVYLLKSFVNLTNAFVKAYGSASKEATK